MVTCVELGAIQTMGCRYMLGVAANTPMFLR
jgi:hypothetical protein